MPHTIVGLGEALWDLLPSGKHLGGAPLNFSYISSLLGERVVIATRVGDDELGRELLDELHLRQLDTSAVQIDNSLPTGSVAVSFVAGQPQYEIRQPVACDNLEWTSAWKSVAQSCDAVCFGSLAQRGVASRATIANFVDHTRPNCLRVFDINLRRPFYSREVLEPALRTANVLKLNDLELPELCEMFKVRDSSPQQQMKELLQRFELLALFVTCGEHGAIGAYQDEVAQHPGFRVQVQDTIGAGDAFTAAAVHCLLEAKSLKETLAFANHWAAWVASQRGGMPQGHPNPEPVEAAQANALRT